MIVVTLVALLCPAGALAVPVEDDLLERIVRYRKQTWRWERLMGQPLTRPSRNPLSAGSEAYHRWVVRVWKARAVRARRAAAHPPRLHAWRCIQRYEAPWHAATGNGYYGGLQMDYGFMRQYGWFLLRRKGAAHRWTPLEQMWVAERAVRAGRGFYPWPNAAAICGLL